VCVFVCPSITLERRERFQPNLIHILLYVCIIYIPQGGWCGRQGIWLIHIVQEIKLLLLLDNRLKHIRGNVRYLVTWNVKEFIFGYSTE
jgi:cytochrome b561